MDALSPAQAAAERPEALALITRERSFRFGELWPRAASLGAELARRVPSDAELAFVASPRWETVALVWALLEARRPFALLHPKWGDEERAAAVGQLSRARFVSEQELLEASMVTRATPGPSGVAAESLAVTLFTSGSSGPPRGVELARSALIASACASLENLPLGPQDRWMLCLPFAHVGGLSVITRSLIARTAVVLSDRFEAADWLATTRRDGVTIASLVPTMLHDLLQVDDRGVLAGRTLLLGGAALSLSARREAIARGTSVLASYGLTEACSQVATQSPAEGHVPSISHVGRPLPGMVVSVIGDDERPCHPGEAGRIVVGGPALFEGYVGEPRRAAGARFDTRDVGFLDVEGCLYLLGRSDDAIITGGENVFPAEIEAALLAHPGALEVVVFGVPDERWGQTVAAALVVTAGTDPVALLEEAGRTLASFKRPRAFAIFDRFPRNAAGKLDRRAVIAAARAGVRRR